MLKNPPLGCLADLSRPLPQAGSLGPTMSPEAQDLDFVSPSVLTFPYAALASEFLPGPSLGIPVSWKPGVVQETTWITQPCPLGGLWLGPLMPAEVF
jgi:hypothetical protein